MKALLGKAALSIFASLFLVLAAVSAAKADVRTELRHACRADIQQYCQSAIGGGREKMRGCVRENASRFSQPCQDALRAAWSARAEQQDRTDKTGQTAK